MVLTVFCVFWGDKYSPGYVYTLRDAVEQHLREPHEFVCITTATLPGITTRLPPVSYSGWWQKIGLFSPTLAMGPSIYLDLDVVICGELDYLVEYANTPRGRLCAPANWAQSGHGGIQSSVMAWSGWWDKPQREFDYPIDSERFYGDQEYLWHLLGNDWIRLPGVCSYKYHCRGKQAPPADASVIAFHGRPDPHELEVNEPWILPFTSILRRHIKSNTACGSREALKRTG